ncbi:hypothetical protein NE237_013437 [Protea cynaroides]|uniref:Uncharacterized protein n=1 Tax=Protea cynaroides TaxID=273540 RepID=A0A9Q0GZX8_9MAGN|nr:hypothetical protein NE237_013437 [Protea cynaroides]
MLLSLQLLLLVLPKQGHILFQGLHRLGRLLPLRKARTAHTRCAENEKAAANVADERSQKIVALLEEIEQLNFEVEQLNAEVVGERQLDIDYRALSELKSSELAQCQAALATLEKAK